MHKTQGRQYWQKLLVAIKQMVLMAWTASPTYLGLALVGTMLLGLLPIVSALALKALVDLVGFISAVGGSPKPGAVVQVLAFYLIVLVCGAAIPLVNQYSNSQLGRRLRLRVQEQIFSRLNQFHGLKYFENPRFYDDIRLAEQGAQSGPTGLFRSVSSAIRNCTTVVGFFGVVSSFSVLVAVLVILSSIPQLWMELRFGRARLALAEQTSPVKRRTFLYGFLLAHPLAAKEVRALGIGQYLLGRFSAGTSEVDNAEASREITEARWQLTMDMISALVTLVAISTAIGKAAEQLLSVGDVTLVVAAVGTVGGSLTGIFRAFATVDESAIFFDKAQQVMGRSETIHIADMPVPIPPINRGIELRDVCFRYGEDLPWLLKGLSLFIPAGKCVALVGANGAGKSTTVKLLLRMYDPTEGAVLWDSHDFRQFDVQELRARIGVVFQDFVRFDMSVKDNIGVGNIDHVNDAALIEGAARRAGIHEAILGLPSGYQTVLSRMVLPDERTRGTDISGGQWQKIAVARMYHRNGDFLILDEPTASLDLESEARLYQEFVQMKEGKTSLIISHRLSTSRMADFIAVLDDGAVVEYGSHQDLLAAGGRYASMYALHLEQLGMNQ